MFDNLSDRLGGVFDKLKGRGALKEQDVRDAMREVRIALLEAEIARVTEHHAKAGAHMAAADALVGKKS